MFKSLSLQVLMEYRNVISHEKKDIIDACQETLLWLETLGGRAGEDWFKYVDSNVTTDIKVKIKGQALLLYQLYHSTLDTERGDCATTFPLHLVLNIVVTHLLKKFSPNLSSAILACLMKLPKFPSHMFSDPNLIFRLSVIFNKLVIVLILTSVKCLMRNFFCIWII